MSSSPDPAEAMQARLREDLRRAMRAKATREVAVLRGCLAAVDDAQAVPVADAHQTYAVRAFGDGSAEVPRLILDAASVRAVLAKEQADRLAAAAHFEQLGDAERAAALRADAAVIGPYL